MLTLIFDVFRENVCTENLFISDLRLNNINTSSSQHFQHLTALTKLVAIDLTSSEIVDDDLISVLKSNPNLKHLIIGK